MIKALYCNDCRDIIRHEATVSWNHWFGYHGYWVDEKGHKQRLDGNTMYQLNHPEDLVQPGDPRFQRLYPKQYAEIQAATERHKQELKQEEEETWKKDKEFTEKFGKEGADALKVAKEYGLA